MKLLIAFAFNFNFCLGVLSFAASGSPTKLVLVLNCGSSSLKSQLFDMKSKQLISKILVDSIGSSDCFKIVNNHKVISLFIKTISN